MDNNEISRLMDVKLDIHDKRPESLKYKAWRRCDVKIEAIKCFPCFLRISFQPLRSDNLADTTSTEEQHMSVSIKVPGVKVSLAVSRTKQHSYGLFWTHNRRDCYIYMALETEESCARHMRWIKKSIKNLELYRQVFLEQRRNSRGPQRAVAQGVAAEKLQHTEMSTGLGPLPKLPFAQLDSFQDGFSSRISDIYEEIFEGPPTSSEPRLSRRFSRSSIASGIYEEMKPTTSNFNAILEEVLAEVGGPQVPPLPPPRKRINTFETDGCLGEIPRSNTNPESEMAKKKKYKNVFDNIFGGGARSKRAESLSEPAGCTVEDILTPRRLKKSLKSNEQAIYANDIVCEAAGSATTVNKRNSFSSPDLSKINFLDTFDEDKLGDILRAPCFDETSGDDLNLSSASLDLSSVRREKPSLLLAQLMRGRADSLESLNVSEQLPNNFNFSACNTSTINLIGSNGAVALQQQKNKIVVEDLTGYCVMAPILKKTSTTLAECHKPQKLIATESGYSTAGSYCSSISSCTQSVDDNHAIRPMRKTDPDEETKPHEESAIYENMHGESSSLNASSVKGKRADNDVSAAATPPNTKFIDNLYENLLAIKAAQELAATLTPPIALSTSTPTDSPQTVINANEVTPKAAHNAEEPEDYYQTPRKSIISVDDKVPSYYPNSCDTVKMRRCQQSPPSATTPTSSQEKPPSLGLRQLVNMKMKRERKENLYISSPQKIIEQRHQGTTSSCNAAHHRTSTKSLSATPTTAPPPTKPTSTLKIKKSGNVYAVNHAAKQSKDPASPHNNNNSQINNNNHRDQDLKAASELLQLSMLPKIDFKFDDQREGEQENHHIVEENYYQCVRTPKRVPSQHHLQLNQTGNTKASTTTPSSSGGSGVVVGVGSSVTPSLTTAQSKVDAKLPVPSEPAVGDLQLSAVKKFASLPRFKKIDFSPLKLRINNVLQRNQHHEF